MHSHILSVTAVALPSESRISGMYEKTDLADAYAIRLPKDAITDPEQLARFLFANQAPWVAGLMRVRDALVACFGIKTAKQLQTPTASNDGKRIYIFKIHAISAHEIVLGENDKHLDFRLSVLHQRSAAATGNASYLILSTVVHCHNRLGRTYIMLIAPFHRMIVQSSLRRAARIGWPTVSST